MAIRLCYSEARLSHRHDLLQLKKHIFWCLKDQYPWKLSDRSQWFWLPGQFSKCTNSKYMKGICFTSCF